MVTKNKASAKEILRLGLLGALCGGGFLCFAVVTSGLNTPQRLSEMWGVPKNWLWLAALGIGAGIGTLVGIAFGLVWFLIKRLVWFLTKRWKK